MYLAITSGSRAAGRLGGGPEHAAETGLAGADRFDVGRRSRHDADCPGAGQDQGGGLRWRERYIERGIEGWRDASRLGRKRPLAAEMIARCGKVRVREYANFRRGSVTATNEGIWERWPRNPL
jgi:hypothetical protein